MNRHSPTDLKQMQSLPLEAKIIMTKARIEAWYESWTRFDIVDRKTGNTRFVTMDTRDMFAEPELKDSEYIQSVFPGQVYVAFSGGKDSTVLKHIVDSMYDDVPSVFVNTGLEYPEIQKFAMSQKNVVTVRPKMRFDEVVKTYGYPVVSKTVSHNISIARRNPEGKVAKNIVHNPDENGLFSCYKWRHLVDAPFRVSDECCNVMKKQPSKMYAKETGRVPILGTRASESNNRYAKWLQNGCNSFESSNPSSQPLSFWTEQDILMYLKKFNVPYCSVYGDIISRGGILQTTGCDRTGCIFCMFGCQRDKKPNRFQRLKETHPRQYEYCIGGGETVDGIWQPSKQGLGLGKVLDYLEVDYKPDESKPRYKTLFNVKDNKRGES